MKPIPLRRRLLLAALAPALAAAADPPTWPSRPLRLVVPFAGGGTIDGIARLLADRLAPRLGQAVVVESRPGAGGNLGMESVARAAGDGHTWLVTSTVAAINPALTRMSFDPVLDLMPVALLARYPVHLFARQGLAAGTYEQLLVLMRSSPTGLSCATSGGITLLAAEQLRQRARAPLVIVPYKGTVPALSDLAAGHIDLVVSTPGTAAALLRDGRIQRIASADPGSGAAPADLDLWGWYAMFAPAGTDPQRIERMNLEVNQAASDPAMQAYLREATVQPGGGSPQQLARLLRADTERFARIARAAGLAPS